MPVQTRMSPDEVAQQGEAWYEKLQTQIEADNMGRYLIVDVETGDYEIGPDYILPTERLLSKRSDAPLYALRIGYRSMGRLASTSVTA